MTIDMMSEPERASSMTTTEPADSGAMPEQGATPEATQDGKPDGATPEDLAGSVQRLEKAILAERDARRKAEEEAAALRATQEAGLSDAEKLAKRITELETAKAEAERKILVNQVLEEHSLPTAWSDRVRGGNETEIRQDVETLKALVPAAATPTPPTQTVGGPQGAVTGTRTPEEWLSWKQANKR